MSQSGYQPRNTPAERRAFFDTQRRIAALEAAGAVVIDWTEGYPTYDPRYVNEADLVTEVEAIGDPRYVNVTGDEMSGRLTVADPGTQRQIVILSNTSGSGSLFGRDAANAVNNGRLTFFDTGGVAIATEQTNQPIKCLVNNLDKVVIGPSDVTTSVPVVLPADPTTALQAATKQYADAAAASAAAGSVVNLTAQTGWTVPSAGFRAKATKIGNLVAVELVCTNSSGGNLVNSVATILPAGYRPASTAVRAPAMNGGVTACISNLATDGSLSIIATVTNGQACYVNFSFNVTA